MVQLAIDGWCRCPQVGDTALHQAVKHGHQMTAEYLLEHGCDINAQNQVRTRLRLRCVDLSWIRTLYKLL